jgi:hypothetical protein
MYQDDMPLPKISEALPVELKQLQILFKALA